MLKNSYYVLKDISTGHYLTTGMFVLTAAIQFAAKFGNSEFIELFFENDTALKYQGYRWEIVHILDTNPEILEGDYIYDDAINDY